MKEKGEVTNWEERFKTAKTNLVNEIKRNFKRGHRDTSVVIRVVSNEWDGGSQALCISDKGAWEGKVQMMGYSIGKKPYIMDLVREYADIKDPDFSAIFFSEQDEEAVALKQERYLTENKERLLMGLVSEMEARISELRQ